MTEEQPILLAFRPGVESDVRYLKNTWLHAFRDGEGAKDIPNSVYFHYEEKILRYIIPRCSNVGGVIVAYENDHVAEWDHIIDRPILGYIVAEPFEGRLLVHMCYVRGFDKPGKRTGSKYRKRGIGTALLQEAMRKFKTPTNEFMYTYRTKMCWHEFNFRQALKRARATYVLYPKYSLLPKNWETGDAPIDE